jgi:hypothetical protein
MKIFIEFLAVFCIICALVSMAIGGNNPADPLDQYAPDPLNATYLIEGQPVRLTAGYCELPAAPGSAMKSRTAVWGQPEYGDMDDDGNTDAAVILTHDPGGSGTFYYVAAAINVNGRYQGTNAVLLGDRIGSAEIAIRSGAAVVKYADRRLKEPMSTAPSVNKSTVLILKNEKLIKIRQFGEGDQIFEGWVTIGHEVRSFLPCSYKKTLWLMGNSPALDEIMAAYGKALPGAMPYTPVFMTLAGRSGKPSADGFGADYEGAFLATRLVQVFPQGNCKSDLIYMESPLPGERVTSPLRIRGYARGKWFFEGDFPVVLRESDGKVIATGYATAKDEWMTDNFVPFESEIKFKMPKPGSRGTLILKKDNPTDLPEHDDELEIAVYFAYQDSMSADPWQKITFDLSSLDESGLYGPTDGKRALSYEFCIPDTVQNRAEVNRIDPTVKFFAQSPGRIGCGESENLCIGSTHQKDFRGVLQRLAELTYVQRIDESFFE